MKYYDSKADLDYVSYDYLVFYSRTLTVVIVQFYNDGLAFWQYIPKSLLFALTLST